MNIYLFYNNQREGPYSLDQIVELNRNGQCRISDLAWHEGLTEWKPIQDIADVMDAILPPLPTVPMPPTVAVASLPLREPPPPPSPSAPLKPVPNISEKLESTKLRLPALLLCLFLGGLGLHSFYAGRLKEGVVLVVLFLIWAIFNNEVSTLSALVLGVILIVHLFGIALGHYKDGQGRLILKWV